MKLWAIKWNKVRIECDNDVTERTERSISVSLQLMQTSIAYNLINKF